MKKGILLLGIMSAFAFPGVAQTFKAYTLQLKANDLVYDSVTQRIYATIPSANGSNGNAIGIINPITHTLDTTIFIGSEPTIMAISGNRQYIYAGSSASSVIWRFKVGTLQVDKTILLGSGGPGSQTRPLFANDIEVMPGSPLVIAVSLKNKGLTPSHEGVAIYDDGVKRPTTTPGHTGSNQIEFAEEQSARLFGYNNESSEAGLRIHTVGATGITTNGVYQNLFAGYYADFIYVSGKLYSTTGTTVDVTGVTPYVTGQFGDITGPVAYDEDAKKVCYASTSGSWGSGYFIFRRFNPNTYLQYDSTAFPLLQENPLKLITCGPDCYAFNTDGGKVIILKPQPAGVETQQIIQSSTLWYPNPAGDFIQLTAPEKVKKVTVLSIDGKVLLTSGGAPSKINLTAFPSGMYNVVVEGTDGVRITQKLLKK